MTLRLFDGRRGELVHFTPIGAGPVGLYVCGITPYDVGHLGHAFTYLSFDVLHRYLKYLGHEVTYVQNLTDVDDDILRKARELGEDYLALGNRHVTAFLAEMATLNWLPPDHYPRATQHIPQMVAMIERLLERGHAYLAEGHVYFGIDSWPTYGELSRLPRSEMLPIANERGNDPQLPGKRDPLDFVLWQTSAADEPWWDSPWGRGRPGWHIECSAMSTTYLGNRFEIHGGGADLAFPHHESEIAQSEGASGERPFVSWWMHAGMLSYQAEKMSKSLGNLILVRDLLRSYRPDAIRLYLAGHHYRSEVVFDAGQLEAASGLATRLRTASLAEEDGAAGSMDGATDPGAPGARVEGHRVGFLDAMGDDLDTPTAIGHLLRLADLALESDDVDVRRLASGSLRDLGTRILGLRLAEVPAEPELDEAVPT